MLSYFAFDSVFSGCDCCCHLPHPAADRPHYRCHSGLLQAQEESSEKWKRRIATSGCIVCVPSHTPTTVGTCGTAGLDWPVRRAGGQI